MNAHQISVGVSAKRDFTFVALRPNHSPMPGTKPILSSHINYQTTCTFEVHRSSGGILKVSAFPTASLAAIINQFVDS